MDKFAKEDEIILQKYVIDDVINGDEGARGEVYRCRSKGKWRVFALKKTRYLKPSNEGIPSTTLEEINERKKLDHPNVIRIIDMKESVDEPIQYLVYEHMEFDLSKYMEFHSRVLENANIMPKEIKMLMYQLLSGLNYCHNRGVFHRNLKPSNLLINQRTSVLKIGDFGLGRGYDDPSKDYHLNVVTPWYRAPELFLGALEYSSSTDIWAVGCILAELYRKRPLFKSSIDVQIHAIFKLIGTPNESVWPGVTKLKYWHEFPKWPKPFNWAGEVPNMDEQGLDLLSKMLQSDPRERITANAAMYHSYFSDIRKHGYLN